MKNKVTLINILTSLLMQLVTVISGLIVPRLILVTFGSSVNGLTSSISQLLSYISLVEGGVTGVIMANMYKPLVEGDQEKLDSILVTCNRFYKKIGYIFIAYTIFIGFVYPFVIETGYPNWYVFVLTCILSLGLMMEYMFSLTLKTLLTADKKIYIISYVKILTTVLNIFVVVLVVKLFPDVIVLKFAGSIAYALQPVIFELYVRKYYKINWKANADNSLIKERWNGFAINIAYFIHTCTDITVLTLFTDLYTVSIYSTYNLIVANINQIIHSVATSLEPIIGQSYATGDIDDLHMKMDMYEYVIFFSVGFLFTVTGLLLCPFIMIYTSGVKDANYYQPLFAALLVISEAIYLIRYPHVSLAYAANKFKEITIPACIEAALNIVLSLILVNKFGIIGVTIGTIAAMTYRMVFHVRFTEKIVPSRKQKIFYKKLCIMVMLTIIVVVICNFIFPMKSLDIIQWILHGVIYSVIYGILAIAVSFIFFKKETKLMLEYTLKRGKN